MGKPNVGNAALFIHESNSVWKGTRGTETSKYPEEKKEKSISKVVASEMDRAQTDSRNITGVMDPKKH